MQLSDLNQALTDLPGRAQMAVLVGDRLYNLDKAVLVRQGGLYVTVLHAGEEIDGQP